MFELACRRELSASRALLSAALGGLVCLGVTACGSSGPNPYAVITSSKIVPGMTENQFKSECAAKGGTFELEPECGGHNSCRGMSYDVGTQTLTEHTCKGMNTCAGYSCIISG